MRFLPNEQGENFKINLYDHGCGVAVGDFNADGYDDLFFTNQLGPNGLFQNRGDGTFRDVTEEFSAVRLDDRICVGATFSDYDNDGDQDLFVTSTRGGNVLFRNEAGEVFVDVTSEAGVECIAHSQTAAFFDFDRDGFLDLLLTNSAEWTTNEFDAQSRYYPGAVDLPSLVSSPVEHNILYRNNRDGTFRDVTEQSNLAGAGWGGDVAIWDFDEDGYLDVLITSMFGVSHLYRNGGNGSFVDVTKATLERTSFGAIGSKVFEMNNDGRFDLALVDMHSDMWMAEDYLPETALEERQKYKYLLGPYPENDPQGLEIERQNADTFQLNYDEVLFGNTLFVSQGDGGYVEISDAAGFETFWPWGIAAGDFDNDGYEDIFLPSGMGYPYRYWKSYLLMNQGGSRFLDRADQFGIEPPARGSYLEEEIGGRPASRSPRCAATADFDGDGRLEIVTNNFNDSPYYFRNNLPQRNYVAFRLTGTRSNRDAIGAVVRLAVGNQRLVRQVQPAGGYLSHCSKTLHFGLGERTRIDRAEIIWPSGQRETLSNVEINKRHDLTERDPETAEAT